jgi:hypothetical protein
LPLSERARVDVYLPDLPKQSYQDLLDAFDQEFTYASGGCTVIRGLEGSYLGLKTRDRINIIYTDTPFLLEENFQALSRYTEDIKAAAFEALSEEAILIVVFRVYHAA